MSRYSHLDPSVQAALNDEMTSIRQSGRHNRLKLDKGTQTLVRFLPVAVGPQQLWYAKVAQHWLNKRPYFCVTKSGANVGGNRDTPCELCEALERAGALNDDQAKAESYGRYTCWCVVFETVDEKGRRYPTPENEMFIPYEVELNKFAFEALYGLYTRAQTKAPYGVLDPTVGRDIWIIKGKDGKVTFDPLDAGPIVTEGDPELFMDKLVAKVKPELFAALTPQQMDEALAKLDDHLAHFSSAGSRRGGGRAPVDEDAQLPAQPRRGVTTTQAAQPARRAPAEAPRASRYSAPPPPPEDDPVDQAQPDDGSNPDLEPASDGPQYAPRQLPARAPAQASATLPPPPARRTLPPPPARASRPAVDPDENLPHETHDAAPPLDPTQPSNPPRTATVAPKLSDRMRANLRAADQPAR